MASAQPYFSVSSTTDGNGLFSYTFDSTSSSYVWGISSDGGEIYIPSFGVLEVICPSGWTDSVDAFQGITLTPTNGTVYLGQPSVTFSVLSSSTATALYDLPQEFSGGSYQMGAVLGDVYTLPDLEGVAGGYTEFSFIGPEAVPEPPAVLLVGFAILLTAVTLAFSHPPMNATPPNPFSGAIASRATHQLSRLKSSGRRG